MDSYCLTVNNYEITIKILVLREFSQNLTSNSTKKIKDFDRSRYMLSQLAKKYPKSTELFYKFCQESD